MLDRTGAGIFDTPLSRRGDMTEGISLQFAPSDVSETVELRLDCVFGELLVLRSTTPLLLTHAVVKSSYSVPPGVMDCGWFEEYLESSCLTFSIICVSFWAPTAASISCCARTDVCAVLLGDVLTELLACLIFLPFLSYWDVLTGELRDSDACAEFTLVSNVSAARGVRCLVVLPLQVLSFWSGDGFTLRTDR